MKTFKEFLKLKEDNGLFGGGVPSGDTTLRSQLPSGKDRDIQPDPGESNSGFIGPKGGGSSTAAVPATPSRMKKMNKDGGDDATGMYTGSGAGLGGMQPVRMRKK
jgi:hypothetical protein